MCSKEEGLTWDWWKLRSDDWYINQQIHLLLYNTYMLRHAFPSWFQTSAVFWMQYSFFLVIPRRLNFMCRRFGTLCLFQLHSWCKQEFTFSKNPWEWHTCAGTCGSLILVINCIVISAIVGWYNICNNTHGTPDIKCITKNCVICTAHLILLG
jgi:hypothetical protein